MIKAGPRLHVEPRTLNQAPHASALLRIILFFYEGCTLRVQQLGESPQPHAQPQARPNRATIPLLDRPQTFYIN